MADFIACDGCAAQCPTVRARQFASESPRLCDACMVYPDPMVRILAGARWAARAPRYVPPGMVACSWCDDEHTERSYVTEDDLYQAALVSRTSSHGRGTERSAEEQEALVLACTTPGAIRDGALAMLRRSPS